MEEDIKILEEELNTYKRHLENYEKEDCLTSVYYELKKYATALENLIKEFKKTKIENIEYKLGQTPDTTEDYKVLKKELEKWKNGEM